MFETVSPRFDRPAEEIVLGFEEAGMDGDELLMEVRFLDGGEDLLSGIGAEDLDKVRSGLELGPDGHAEPVRAIHFHDPADAAFRAVAARGGNSSPANDGSRAVENARGERLPGRDIHIIVSADIADGRYSDHETSVEKVLCAER
jgi:hypothetical protein